MEAPTKILILMGIIMNDIKLENDIPKYKKKKNSSTSKSKEKSNHKHEYVDCLLVEKDENRPYKAKYCSICGKVNDVKFFEFTPCESAYSRLLNDDEVFEKYKDLESIYIDNIWKLKYISVDNN